MSKQEMSRDDAAEIFVRTVTNTGCTISHRDFMEGLIKGTPKRSFSSMSEWYRALEAPDREQVEHIVSRAMNFTVFNLLCLLDGVSGFERIDGEPVHFALNIERYEDIDALLEERSPKRICINPPNEEDITLHDLFKEMTQTT